MECVKKKRHFILWCSTLLTFLLLSRSLGVPLRLLLFYASIDFCPMLDRGYFFKNELGLSVSLKAERVFTSSLPNHQRWDPFRTAALSLAPSHFQLEFDIWKKIVLPSGAFPLMRCFIQRGETPKHYCSLKVKKNLEKNWTFLQLVFWSHTNLVL